MVEHLYKQVDGYTNSSMKMKELFTCMMMLASSMNPLF
ncbi:hypothetical protein MUK42_12723 [Musa troglodytarum]|uniref:Uncharacterized protein n=1 Tax=Musa troglodytarum TaxID=320322 RepID=A0A9E7GNF5_9LILI|nr:hypothetical protein MUK42_12723 [Musa troglodytarum]